MKTFPLYSVKQTRELDARCIDDEQISGYQLMQRAGLAAFRVIQERWPKLNAVTIVCGTGNNGGDGYVIAKLAHQQNMLVDVVQLGDSERLTPSAKLAFASMEDVGVLAKRFLREEKNQTYEFAFTGEIIVDAIFGTGLSSANETSAGIRATSREITGEWQAAIEAINRSSKPVVAIDIASGLCAETGAVLNCAVVADVTITFIARKLGLYTGDGRAVSGDVKFESLEVSENVYRQVPTGLQLVSTLAGPLLSKRPINSHKNTFGHVLVVGGAPSMRGAAQLAAHAALRVGAGLVSVATHPSHASLFNLTLPELMVEGVKDECSLKRMIVNADVIIVGPGLGTTEWAKMLFEAVISSELPIVIDADGLSLLAGSSIELEGNLNSNIEPRRKTINSVSRNSWVLTPHPGEAARLLETTGHAIQQDRLISAKRIQQKFGGVCVLKGAGTIVQGVGCHTNSGYNAHAQDEIGVASYVCPYGNPGMASAGMGDVLAGVIGGLIAQSDISKSHLLDNKLLDIAAFAVTLHAQAGDEVANKMGEKGMLASDLIPVMRELINQNE